MSCTKGAGRECCDSTLHGLEVLHLQLGHPAIVLDIIARCPCCTPDVRDVAADRECVDTWGGDAKGMLHSPLVFELYGRAPHATVLPPLTRSKTHRPH